MSEIKQVENMERKYKQTDIGLVFNFGLTLFSTRYKPLIILEFVPVSGYTIDMAFLQHINHEILITKEYRNKIKR